jgi:hypothetical protein
MYMVCMCIVCNVNMCMHYIYMCVCVYIYIYIYIYWGEFLLLLDISTLGETPFLDLEVPAFRPDGIRV